MKIRRKTLLICIAIPLTVGGAAALLTMGSMETFGQLNKPPLSPPAWLFPVVWTLLYTLMGIASYLVVTSHNARQAISNAIGLYAAQLAVNFFWSILFFNFSAYLLSFLWLLLLWGLILATLIAFYRLSPAAGYLLVPYLIWVTFAGYLNFAIYLLN